MRRRAAAQRARPANSCCARRAGSRARSPGTSPEAARLKLSTTRLFPLLLMLSLAALSFWLERTVREEEGAHPSLRRHDPDYIIDNLKHTHFNAQGAVESTLVAAKML